MEKKTNPFSKRLEKSNGELYMICKALALSSPLVRLAESATSEKPHLQPTMLGSSWRQLEQGLKEHTQDCAPVS